MFCIEIDFDSEEALYMQLRNQIIMGIAMKKLTDGQSLPSVRALADEIGINMHTVNKAYALLRQEGFIRLDRRRGAVIALNDDKLEALNQMREDLKVILAWGRCKNIEAPEVHMLIDEIYSDYEKVKGR